MGQQDPKAFHKGTPRAAMPLRASRRGDTLHKGTQGSRSKAHPAVCLGRFQRLASLCPIPTSTLRLNRYFTIYPDDIHSMAPMPRHLALLPLRFLFVVALAIGGHNCDGGPHRHQGHLRAFHGHCQSCPLRPCDFLIPPTLFVPV